MRINIYTLTSALHDAATLKDTTRQFLSTLTCDYDFKGENFDTFGQQGIDLIYVRTGGTEGLFLNMLNQLPVRPTKFYLLTSGQSNSLAASMEILSYLNNNGMTGEILHGDPEYINRRIDEITTVENARTRLANTTLGVIGRPSDWLISSGVDYEVARQRLGVKLIDIDMEEMLEEYNKTQADHKDELDLMARNDEEKQRITAATRLYVALKVIVERYKLNGFTIRCFDLLTSLRTTGCLALARFNSEGIIATCEGDIPALLSMTVAHALTGVTGFQANPSTINPVTGEMLFAHCTIPFNMVERFELDTHFESGIGVGIRGYSKPGPVTVFKLAGDASRHFAQQGQLLRCQGEPNLCRTQQVIRLDDPEATRYFLTRPIGNHHIIVPGHQAALISLLLD